MLAPKKYLFILFLFFLIDFISAQTVNKLPNDLEARKGIFDVAKWHYDQENFPKALKIFEKKCDQKIL